MQAHADATDDWWPVPRTARFPIELALPPGFRVDDLSTWPQVEGSVEYLGGRLWFMPPCGDRQGFTVSDVHAALTPWKRRHPEFVVHVNETGMKLGQDLRAADLAIWRRADRPAEPGGVYRVPPVLAVEVAGRRERRETLLDKARWYLDCGTEVVWLVFPAELEVLFVTAGGRSTHQPGDTLPEHPALPGLRPSVDGLLEEMLRRTE